MKFLAFCLTLFFFAGCNKSDYIPVHGGGGGSKEKIIGTVYLFDDLANDAPDSNMTVTIDGTAFTTTTDSSGKYSFKDVPAGTYNLTYSKPGYGTYRLDTFHVVYNSNDTPAVVPAKALGTLSTTTVTDLFISVEGDTIKIIPTINPAGNEIIARGVRFFYGADESVTGTDFLSYSKQFRLKKDSDPIKVSKTDFYDAGFSPGATIYVRVYGDAIFSNDYIDLTTGKSIFPNLNPTTVASKSFVLP
ncbi:MAG TPA: carboxypeptidase-like regulatory domain-containing protein [Panacibacter sp.]|nr:carboxypeptidase-like regulatory domain-containing protein [Panacibacter sp.]